MLNQNIKYICVLFPFVIFKKELLTWMFTEQRSPFFIPIEEMEFFFFSIIILCCIIAYCVISVSKAAIHNILISKVFMWFYVVKLINA